MKQASRGFTLIEMMVTSVTAVVIISSGVWAVMKIQNNAWIQDQSLGAYQTARFVKDFQFRVLIKAGGGFGSTRINVGGTANAYPVSITTLAQFPDATFAGPSGQYAGMTSDALEIWAADSASILRLGSCANGWHRSGDDICATAAPDATWLNKPVVFTNPIEGTAACFGVITSLGSGTMFRASSGTPHSAPPAADPCAAPTVGGGALWKSGGTVAMPLAGGAFRVNWKSGTPTLEFDPDGSGNSAQTYQALSPHIERMTVRAVAVNPSNPNVQLWFPEPAGATSRPAIDLCTNAACDQYVLQLGGYLTADLPAGDAARARDALQRRIRGVQVVITARSERQDPDTVQRTADGYRMGSDGVPMDGYKRTTFVSEVTPRNLRFAGSAP